METNINISKTGHPTESCSWLWSQWNVVDFFYCSFGMKDVDLYPILYGGIQDQESQKYVSDKQSVLLQIGA